MVSVYALLCAATLLRGECTTTTAIDVIRLPDADNELACLRGSMMTLGPLAIQPEAGEYCKVVCTHSGSDLPNVAESPQSDLSIVQHAPPLDSANRNFLLILTDHEGGFLCLVPQKRGHRRHYPTIAEPPSAKFRTASGYDR